MWKHTVLFDSNQRVVSFWKTNGHFDTVIVHFEQEMSLLSFDVSTTRRACESAYFINAESLICTCAVASHAKHVKVRIFKNAFFVNAESRIFIDKCRYYCSYGLVVRACGIPTVAVSSTRHACESAYFL